MPPKKGEGKKKGKKKGKSAPPHDTDWEKAVSTGRWERPVEALPNPATHASFAEVREKMLAALQHISIHWSATVTDDFIKELFSIRREKLRTLEVRGASMLTQIILSPSTIAPDLHFLDLSCCKVLEYVFLQSTSLEKISLYRCMLLKKAVLHTKQLKEVNLLECKKLSSLLLWSDVLTKLDLPTTDAPFTILDLHCPSLINLESIEKVQHIMVQQASKVSTTHPTINKILEHEFIKRRNEGHIEDQKEANFEFIAPLNNVVLPQSCFIGY